MELEAPCLIKALDLHASVQPVEPQTRVKSGRNVFFLPDFQFICIQSDGFATEQTLGHLGAQLPQRLPKTKEESCFG